MSDIQGLDLAGLANLEAQLTAARTALVVARDARYAEASTEFFGTVVSENPRTETPTSNYAGYRVQFPVTIDGVEFIASVDLRDVKRSAERKAEKALADAQAETAPEPEPAKAGK